MAAATALLTAVTTGTASAATTAGAATASGTATTAAAATAPGESAAHAAALGQAPSILRPASHPRWDAVTEPARGINRFPDPFTDSTGRHRLHGGVANQTSGNWAGYAATGGTYQTVSASWIEPDVTCTSDGIVAFWVGLDGWGSSSVEQDGTGVDCSTGTPQQFAWWETYPANSIQEYDDPVSAGDRMTAGVTSAAGGVYDLVLTDVTKGWTERNPVQVTGAQDASAEVVAEAVTSGNTITQLPDFHSVGFTGATINGKSLQATGAVPVDMTDGTGALVAKTQNADSAGDFQVDFAGPSQSGLLKSVPNRSMSK